MKKDEPQVAARIPRELFDRWQECLKTAGHTQTWQITKLITEWVESREKHERGKKSNGQTLAGN
jgi:hypothetical protein